MKCIARLPCEIFVKKISIVCMVCVVAVLLKDELARILTCGRQQLQP